MMALEMTWVVETGIPSGRREEDGGGGGLGGEAVDRLQLHDPLAHRVHDPPAADGGAEDSAVAETTITQTGTSMVGITPPRTARA